MNFKRVLIKFSIPNLSIIFVFVQCKKSLKQASKTRFQQKKIFLICALVVNFGLYPIQKYGEDKKSYIIFAYFHKQYSCYIEHDPIILIVLLLCT